MKVLIAYESKTGNTKKIAETIYGAIDCKKDIMPIKEVNSLKKYDLVFLGFPIIGNGPSRPAEEFLSKVKGPKVAIFITHAAPEDFKELPDWIANFKAALKNAKLVGVFNCQGKLGRFIKFIMLCMFGTKMREWAKMDTSKGQPDENRLKKADFFAKEIIKRNS